MDCIHLLEYLQGKVCHYGEKAIMVKRWDSAMKNVMEREVSNMVGWFK